MIITNEEYTARKEAIKADFAYCTNNDLLEHYNTYSMCYVIHEGDKAEQLHCVEVCGALKELIIARMK